MTFSAWLAGTISRYSTGESAHTNRAARSNATLGDCMQRDQHHLGDVGDLQRDLGEVSSCGLCRAKQQGNPSVSAPAFCRHQNFVDMSILSTPTFCPREYFVDANILSTPVISVDTNISVGANILSLPMFCRHQYFVATYIFYCVQVNNDYLVLIFGFCVYCGGGIYDTTKQ